MICAAIAFWVPIASMVMIAPWMSTSLRSSGIAVISFDFSAHATCPNDRPNSLAQTLTECKAPRPFLRSWLRRAVLPSTARMGCSTPVTAVASARNDCSQLAKQAWKAAGFKAIRTRRKTSLLGIPLGKSSASKRNSCFRTAHCVIAVGPPAPASTASKAMTTTLSKGCRRLISERGSSSSSKCRMTSSNPICRASAMVPPCCAALIEATQGRYTRKHPRAQALQITKITHKCALALFAEPRVCDNAGRIEWLVRACQDRSVVVGEAASEVTQMREAALAAPALFAQEITVRGRTPKTACEDRARRQPRSTRKAIVTVRAKSVTLLPPKRAGQALSPVTVNVVLVREDAPPEGEVPVEWVLVTTLPIGDVEAVRKVVAYYTVRWMIELLFRTLKSGCRLEKRRFEDLDRLLPCAAVYLIIAWRTLMVCRMGRSCPDISCEAIFEPEEWKAVYVTLRRQPPPSQPPRLEDMIRLIAQLGGYVNRPARKDPPGVQTLWLGMQRMQDLAWAWCTFGPGAPNGF